MSEIHPEDELGFNPLPNIHTGEGEESIPLPKETRASRQLSRTEKEVLDCQRVSELYDYTAEEELLYREAVEGDPNWQATEDEVDAQFKKVNTDILILARETFAMLKIADAGSLHTYGDIRIFERFLREPELLRRLTEHAMFDCHVSGREYTTVEDLRKIVIQDGFDKIAQEQTESDAKELSKIGIDEEELDRRVEDGTFGQKREVRSLARLLREQPLGQFRETITEQAAEKGPVNFYEVLNRARGIMARYNRQQAELAQGEERAMKRREQMLGQLAVRQRILNELGWLLNQEKMRRNGLSDDPRNDPLEDDDREEESQ